MKILVIGGSRFLGRFVVEEALRKGYQVTVFNRGQHNGIFEDQPVEQLIGDRKQDLSLLQNRSWDAVVDTCAYLPHDVTSLLDVLDGKLKHYTMISSISVYQDWAPEGINEQYITPTLSNEKLQELLQDPSVSLPGPYYGHLKRMCEIEAERLMPGRVLNVRPGLIVGPHDESDRLTYWVRRVSEGGTVLAPEFPTQQIQFIDGRDRPAKPLTMEQFLNTCRSVTNSDAAWV
nr:NAD-dependent epimerase/dehydratase family protein [Paenibacillus guangzhouensis]